MIRIGQLPRTAPACDTSMRRPAVRIASARKFSWSIVSEVAGCGRRAPIAGPNRRHAPAPGACCRSGPGSLRRFSGRRNCGGSPVYSGGVSQMSRLAAMAGGPASRLGVTARTRRSRQSPPASTAPSSSSIASKARSAPWVARGEPGDRRPDPQALRRGPHLPLMRLPQPRRLRVSGTLGRSASACSGRWTARSRARCGAGRRQCRASATPRNAAARASRNAAPKTSSSAAWTRPRQPRQQIEQRHDQKQPEDRQRRPAGRPHPLPQQRRAGERRAAGANGKRGIWRGARSSGASLARRVAGRCRRAKPEVYQATRAPHSSAAPGSRQSARRRPSPRGPGGGCCSSSS